MSEISVGSILDGKVTGITKFGAFVALPEGKSGLVHISEIANSFVNDVHDFLQEGQTVKVLVLSTENGKINLSIKKALPQQERRPSGPVPAVPPVPAARPAIPVPRAALPSPGRPLPVSSPRWRPLRTSPLRTSSSSSSPPRRGRWPT